MPSTTDQRYRGAAACLAYLAQGLKGRVDDAAWDAFAGTVSLPFPARTERRIAVKVIDPRGNEVMRVHRLPAASGAAGAAA